MTEAVSRIGERASWDRVVTGWLEAAGYVTRYRGDDHVEFRCPAHEDHRASGTADYRPGHPGEPGRVLLHCHGGCEVEDILAAGPLRMADLFDGPAPRDARPVPRPRKAPERARPAPSAPACRHRYSPDPDYPEHPYVTADGVLVARVLRKRCDRPGCGQKRVQPDRRGWAEADRVLYRLPEVLAAIEAGQTVYVVEGEKSADALARAGYVATTNPFGAGKWLPLHTGALAGAARVVVIADNDRDGYAHAAHVAGQLAAAGVPDVGTVRAAADIPKVDVVDHLAAGGTVETLVPVDPRARLAEPDGEPVAPVTELDAHRGGGRGGRGGRGRRDDADGAGESAAPHLANVSGSVGRDSFTWSAGAAGAPHKNAVGQQCTACEPIDRGLYLGERRVADLPYADARVLTGHGRTQDVAFLLSRDADGTGRGMFTAEDIERGRAARRIGVTWTPDHRISDAWGAVVYELAAAAPEVSATVRPDDRRDGKIPLPPREAAPEGYFTRRPGHPDRGRQGAAAMASVARSCPKVALALGASVMAPVTGPLARQSHWLSLIGPRRQGKTTTLQGAAAVWGDPRQPPAPGIYASWDATAKGPQRRLGNLGIFPMFLDEIGTADLSPGEMARQVLTTCQGASRLMADTNSDAERRTPGWQGVIMVTGNGKVTGGVPLVGRLAGVAARIIELETPFTNSHTEARRLERAARHGWGWLGPEVLGRFTVPELDALIGRERKALNVPEGGTAGTLAGHLAAAVAGAAAADAVLGTAALAPAARRAAAEYLAGHTAEPESDSERLLSVLAEYMASNRPAWPTESAYRALAQVREIAPNLPQHGHESTSDGVLGDQWAWVFPATLDRLCEQEGIDKGTALRELHDVGQLHAEAARVAKGDGYLANKRFGPGQRARVYWIALSALDPGDDDVQDHDADPPAPPSSPPEPPPAPAPAPGSQWPEDTAGAAAQEGTLLLEETPPSPAPATVTPARPGDGAAPADTDRWLAAAGERLKWSPAQLQELTRRVTLLATLPGDVPTDKLAGRLRVLAALEGNDHGPAGPFAPIRGKKQPYWAPKLPRAVEDAYVPKGWSFERPGYSGPVIKLDRNGAYVAATASVEVTHGKLTQSGPVDELPERPRPGYYLVTAYPWMEDELPSPLGGIEPGRQVWVPAPLARLLRELADADRWPDAGAADSWTGDPVRLDRWAHLVRELRRYALEVHGRESDQYTAVKLAFGQARGLMQGSWDSSPGTLRKVWKCRCHRWDWDQHLETLAAVNLWRVGDKCRQAGPGLGPVALRNTDELVLTAAALGQVTGSVVRIGEGWELGTFKVTAREDWGAE